MKYFSNLSKYDEKGKRLAIFAEVDSSSPNKLHIFILKCSKKDQFTKALAREIFGIYQNTRQLPIVGTKSSVSEYGVTYHPILDVITINNPATPKKCFLEWCNSTFYSYRDRTIYIPSAIVSIKRHIKMTPYITITTLTKSWEPKEK